MRYVGSMPQVKHAGHAQMLVLPSADISFFGTPMNHNNLSACTDPKRLQLDTCGSVNMPSDNTF